MDKISEITVIKNDINKLREALDMIEWCLDKNSKNVKLYVDDIHPLVSNIINHF